MLHRPFRKRQSSTCQSSTYKPVVVDANHLAEPDPTTMTSKSSTGMKPALEKKSIHRKFPSFLENQFISSSICSDK
jgi:hypothetical protein